MKPSVFFPLLLAVSLAFQLDGQRNPGFSGSRDTIYVKKIFLNRSYFLDGKPLNLSVMEWFMKDFPKAHDEIQLAILSDQFSIAGYGAGSLFLISGLLVYRQNPRVGIDLMQVGGICAAGGVIFQVVSGKFKKNAVNLYNAAVQAPAEKSTASYSLEISDDGKVGLWISFE